MATSKNSDTPALKKDDKASHAPASAFEDIPFIPAFDLLPTAAQTDIATSQELPAGELTTTDIAVVGAALWEASHQGQNFSSPAPTAPHGSRWLLAARIGGVSTRY